MWLVYSITFDSKFLINLIISPELIQVRTGPVLKLLKQDLLQARCSSYTEQPANLWMETGQGAS